MPREESIETKIRRNKLIAVLTLFVTIVMPIIGFFSIPMPATKNDIIMLERADAEIKVDIEQVAYKSKAKGIETEIKLLIMDEERHTLRRYENLRQQDTYRIENKPVPQVYAAELGEIDAKLNETKHQLDTQKQELIFIKEKIE